jgi:hypothetical protein
MLPAGLTRRQARKLENDAAGRARYLEALARIGTVSGALKASGSSTYDLHRWREDDEFDASERIARDVIADALEAEAIRRAYKGTRKPVYQGGLLAGYVTEYSDTLLQFMLKAMRPEKYRERQDITVHPIVKVVAGFEPSDVV